MSRFSPMIIWPKFNWEFDVQLVYYKGNCAYNWVGFSCQNSTHLGLTVNQ